MRLVIDSDVCTGHGRCYDEAPLAVDADDDGRGVVIHDELPEGLLNTSRAAVDSCPERAVRLED